MAGLKSLDLTGASGRVQVDCVPGTRFVVDVDQGAVLRVPSGRAPRPPLDGRWWRASALVDDVTGEPTVRVGASARWNLAPDLYVITGSILRITMGGALAAPAVLAPDLVWPFGAPV